MSYISCHNFHCIFYIRKLNQGFEKNYLLYLVLEVIWKKDLINLAFLITKHIRKKKLFATPLGINSGENI